MTHGRRDRKPATPRDLKPTYSARPTPIDPPPGAAPAPASPEAAPAGAPIRIGIRSQSTPGLGDTGFEPRHLDTLGAAGFDLVELNFNKTDPFLDPTDAANAAALRAEAERLGMTLVAHAPDQLPITLADRAAALRNAAALTDHFLGMAAFGIRMINLHPCGYDTTPPDRVDEQMQSLHACLEVLADVCDACAIDLALETLTPGNLSARMDHLIDAVDRLDHPRVGICLDTNHLNLSEDINDATRRAGRRIKEFHINDNHLIWEEHLLPYTGLIDWPAFAAAVADIDYTGVMIMEPSWRKGEDPHEMLHEAKRAAERLLSDMQR